MTTPTPDSAPVSILFVCLGNICRSPMAEAVLRSLTAHNTASAHPQIARIDSCGTGAYHTGAAPDPRTMKVLHAHGITDYAHAARRVRVPEDLDEFDYVLGMDGENVADLQDMLARARRKRAREGEAVGQRAKVMLFGEFGGQGGEEVGDPYYGGSDGFEVAYEQVERCAKGLLEHVEAEAAS